MKKKHTPLTNDEVRVIKISEAALYEFIYEKFIDDQDTYLDVDNLSVTDSFYMDWENRQFIVCAYKTEDENGELLEFHESIDIEKYFAMQQNLEKHLKKALCPVTVYMKEWTLSRREKIMNIVPERELNSYAFMLPGNTLFMPISC